MKCPGLSATPGSASPQRIRRKVFEEFQQVGTAAKKVEGTGLPKAHLVPEVCGTPRRADLGEERGRDGLHVYLHNTGAAWRMS
jgi:hypothetical protein